MSFIHNSQAESANPGYKEWKIKEFSQIRMVFQLEFSNPLNVSAGEKKDELLIEINEPRIFKRK